MEAEVRLWQRWRGGQDFAARDELIEMHRPYAKVVAATCYKRRFNDEIEFDDYLQLATVALVESMDRFDPLHGVKFRTFASHRMQGAILDGLQQMTEKQRQISASKRLLAQGADALLSQDDRVLNLVAEAGIAIALAWLLEGTGMLRAKDESAEMHFYRSTEIDQLRERVRQVVQTLPARERSVIRGHYFQQQPFEEIARDLELSASRISQLHRRGLERVKELMLRRRGFDASG